uniref:Mitochondrial fission regulator n=1 Tax=Denticeps clupeoides TaxID=299321 RepID=A0A8C3ZUS6_9TELE
MSLVEDLAELARCVLEYFGVPADMLVPVWDSHLCGRNRSVVRMIGSSLALSPYPRLHFQIPLQVSRPGGHLDAAADCPAVATFADVLWVAEHDGERFATLRSPGGTPVRKRRSKGPGCPSDPVALISEALRKKFAHRHHNSSFDKENRSAELSPFGSPETHAVSGSCL